MIIQSQVHLSPELTVLIDGVPVHYRYIQRIEHSMEPDHHDMVLMHVTGLPPRAVRDYRNAPVTYTGRLTGGYTESFFGYIIDVHLETATAAGTVNNSPLQSATLVCMGMSYDLRGEKHKSWDGYRLQDVVAVLSAQHGFSYDVPDDPLLYSPMIQDAESDWQFVVRYAKMLGYETTMHGTHLHIFDPYKAFSRGISYHRLTSHRDIPKLMTQNPGNVLSFKAQMGERHPDGVYKDTAISVHQDDGYVYDLRLSELRGLKQPGKYSNRLLDSVDNYDQAVRSINAHRKGIYDFTAVLQFWESLAVVLVG